MAHGGEYGTNGTEYIHDKNGTFHLEIISTAQSYTLIIEQNLESIPEFPSWAPMLIVLLIIAIVSVIYRPKLFKSPSK